MLRSLALIGVLLFTFSVQAEGRSKSKHSATLKSSLKAKKKKKSKVRVLQISTPNAEAYDEPSFDARVIIRLKRGQKLYGLKRKISGTDGLGLFYKVRLKKGVYAYILDTSVKGFRPRAELRSGGGISGRATQAKKNTNTKSEKSKTSYDGYSVPYSKSYGVVVSSLDYGFKTGGGDQSSKETFLGLKLSGAGWVSKSIPVDISFLYSSSSPKLFDSFTQAHSGSMFFLEGAIPLEWKKGKNWSIYGSVGAVISYYNFDITLGGETGDSKKTELGYSLGLAGGVRLGRYLLKAEVKYFKTGAKSIGSQVSLQRIF